MNRFAREGGGRVEGPRRLEDRDYLFRKPLGEHRRFMRHIAYESAGGKGVENIRFDIDEKADQAVARVLLDGLTPENGFMRDENSNSAYAYFYKGDDLVGDIYKIVDPEFRGTDKDTDPDGI